MMYYVFVILTTVALPSASIAIEHLAQPQADLVTLLGKWFVFWGVGIRLLAAGATQVLRPSFTASSILGTGDAGAETVVAELGYANIAMGLTGALSMLWPEWTIPAGLAGGLFLGVAGIKHAMNSQRNAKGNVAMVTDLLVSAMVAIYLAGSAIQ
jgi:hypothetical protein